MNMGRCVSSFRTGTADRSRVFLVAVSKVLMPLSHRIICELPWEAMYSADMRNSFKVADKPLLRRTGFPALPTSMRRLKFCMFLAPIWIMSTYSHMSSVSRGSMSSLIMGRPVSFFASARSFKPVCAKPLESHKERSWA